MSEFQLSVLAVLIAALGMTCARSSGEGGEPKPASPVAPTDASSPKNAFQLLQDYTRLVSPENIDEVFDLFSEDALLEFPFFKSIGIPARLAGRETIRKQIAPFVKNETENFRFHDIKIWASAEPDRAFGEYSVTAKIKFDRTSVQSNVCGPLRNEERKNCSSCRIRRAPKSRGSEYRRAEVSLRPNPSSD